MNVIQRGNPSIMSKIRENAKAVSVASGYDKPLLVSGNTPVRDTTPIPGNITEMFNGTNSNLVSNTVSPVKQPTFIGESNKVDLGKSMIERVYNNLDTLSDTKEYFNAIQDLLALYVSGNLNKDVLSRISDEDMREIKGVVREFKAIIDAY